MTTLLREYRDTVWQVVWLHYVIVNIIQGEPQGTSALLRRCFETGICFCSGLHFIFLFELLSFDTTRFNGMTKPSPYRDSIIKLHREIRSSLQVHCNVAYTIIRRFMELGSSAHRSGRGRVRSVVTTSNIKKVCERFRRNPIEKYGHQSCVNATICQEISKTETVQEGRSSNLDAARS